MVDNKGYRHTLKKCNTNCYSGYANACQCYAIFTMPVLFLYVSIHTM